MAGENAARLMQARCARLAENYMRDRLHDGDDDAAWRFRDLAAEIRNLTVGE